MNHTHHISASPRLIIGSLLIILGGLLVMANIGLIGEWPVWKLWPLAIVGLGLYKRAEAESARERRDAFWFIVIGGWLCLSIFRIFGLGFSNSWPILIIAWGISVIWEEHARARRHTTSMENDHGS